MVLDQYFEFLQTFGLKCEMRGGEMEEKKHKHGRYETVCRPAYWNTKWTPVGA